MGKEVTTDAHNLPAEAALSDIIQLLTNYRRDMAAHIEKLENRISELEEDNQALMTKVRELKNK